MDRAISNNENISIEWSGHQSIPENRYTVSDIMSGSDSITYIATLIISPLAVQDDDDGMITCTVTVTGGTSATANDNVTIIVIG